MTPVLKVLPGIGLVLYGFVLLPTISNMESADVVKILDWIDAMVSLARNQSMPKTMRNVSVPRPGLSIQRSSSNLTTATQHQGRTLHDRFLNALFDARFLDRSQAPYLGISSRARLQRMSHVAHIPASTLHKRLMRVLSRIPWRRRLEEIARALSVDDLLRDAESSRMNILLVPILVGAVLGRLLHRGSTTRSKRSSPSIDATSFRSQTTTDRKLSNAGLTSAVEGGAQETASEGCWENPVAGEITKPLQRIHFWLHPPDGASNHGSIAAQPFDPQDWKDSDDGASIATVIECPDLVVAELWPPRGDSSDDERQDLPEVKEHARNDAHEGACHRTRRCRKPPTLSSAAVLLPSVLPKFYTLADPIAPRGTHVLPPGGDHKWALADGSCQFNA